MPFASITADAIVAFPGETDAQFEKTLAIIKEVGFDQVNTAAYSPRPNTPAANWPNQLPEKIKVERLQELNKLVEETAKKRNLRFQDKIEEVLIEGINFKDKEQVMGRTRSNRLTFFPKESVNGKSYKAGDIVNVKIIEVRAFSLTGMPQ